MNVLGNESEKVNLNVGIVPRKPAATVDGVTEPEEAL